MRFLTTTENKNFYLQQDCVFNQNLQVCIGKVRKSINFYLFEDDGVEFYSSGALLISKHNHSINLMFVKNNGETLFSVQEKELDDLGCDLYDVNAFVCGTGVLVYYDYGNEPKHEYFYYTYNGAYIRDTNLERLVEKVNKYERALGVYYDNSPIQKDVKPNTQYILDCLNNQDGSEKTSEIEM